MKLPTEFAGTTRQQLFPISAFYFSGENRKLEVGQTDVLTKIENRQVFRVSILELESETFGLGQQHCFGSVEERL